MTKKPHGGKRPGAGRKPSGKVRLQCWVNPETRAKLGDKPGAKLDEMFGDFLKSLEGVQYKSFRKSLLTPTQPAADFSP